MLVGYERKVLSDMVTSMRDKRFQGHQLPGLLEQYAVVTLIVEGIWRVGAGGVVEVAGGGNGWRPYKFGGGSPILYRELDHFWATLQYKHGVVVVCTANREQTAAYLVSRWKWWNDKTFDQHRSCDTIYAPFTPTVAGTGNGVRRGSFVRRTIPKVEKMVAQLDGVDRAAFAIGQRFRNVEQLMGATVEELAETLIEQVGGKVGRRKVRLGDKKAESIFRQLREQ